MGTIIRSLLGKMSIVAVITVIRRLLYLSHIPGLESVLQLTTRWHCNRGNATFLEQKGKYLYLNRWRIIQNPQCICFFIELRCTK